MTPELHKHVNRTIDAIRGGLFIAIGESVGLSVVRDYLDNPGGYADNSDHPSDIEALEYYRGWLDGAAAGLGLVGGSVELFDLWRKDQP